MSNVRVGIVYDGEEFSRVFSSRQAFIDELVVHLASGGSLLEPFGVSDVSIGSDNKLLISGTDGADYTFAWVQQEFSSGDYTRLNTMFEITPTNDYAPPSAGSISLNNVNPAFRNNSSRLDELKTEIKKHENEKAMRDAINESCHVEYRLNKYHTTFEAIRDYYLGLSCVFFGLELRLVNNPLINVFRGFIGLDDDYAKNKTQPVANTLRKRNRFVYTLRRGLKRTVDNLAVGIDYACTLDDIQIFASTLQMDIYIVKAHEYLNVKRELSLKGFALKHLKDMPRFRTSLMTGKFSYIDKICGATTSRIHMGEDSAIVMRKSDQFKEYGHIEVCHSASVTKSIVAGEQLSVSSNLNTNTAIDGFVDDIVANAKYETHPLFNVSDRTPLNPQYNHLQPGVPVTSADVRTMEDLDGVIKQINTIGDHINDKSSELSSSDSTIRRAALVEIQQLCPSIVIIEPGMFRDRDVQMEMDEPSTLNMLNIMSYVYNETILSEKSGAHKVSLTRFLPDISNQQLRKISTRNKIRLEKGENKHEFNVVRNVKSFSLCVDAHNDNGEILNCPIPLIRFINRNKTVYDVGVNMFMNGRKDIPFIDRMLNGLEINAIEEWYESHDQDSMSEDAIKALEHRFREKLKKPTKLPTSIYKGINENNSLVREIVNGDLVSKVMRETFVGKTNGGTILRPVMSIETPAIEKLRAYKNNMSEPSVSRGHNTTNFDKSKKSVLLVDANKFYASIAMGGYFKIPRTDWYFDRLVFGGDINCSMERISDPILSYSIDNGKVFVEGSKIKWDQLSKLDPGYLTNMSSYHAWRSCSKFVESYMVIHLCFKICEAKRMFKPDKDKLELIRHIQFDLLGIKDGMFVFSKKDREFMHKVFAETNVLRIRMNQLDTVASGLSSKLQSFMQLPSDPIPLFANGKPAPAVNKKNYQMKGSVYNFAKLVQLTSRTFHTILKYANNDVSVLKMMVNKWIGGLKQGADGGIRVRTAMDRLVDERSEKDGDIQIFNQGEEISNNTSMSVVHMPYLARQYLVTQNRVSIVPKRNGLSTLRNYIINVGALSMNELAQRTGSYRNYVDSVMIDIELKEHAQDFFNSYVRGSAGKTTVEHFAPGHMPSYSIEVVDLDKPVKEEAFMNGEPLETKYEIFKCKSVSGINKVIVEEDKEDYDRGYEHYVHGEEHEYVEQRGQLCGYTRTLLNESKTTWETTTASSVLFDIAVEMEIVPPGITNGVDLHRKFWTLVNANDDIKDLYEQFNHSFAEMVAKQSCVIYGEPGSGKTFTFGGIVDIFKRKRKKVSAASQMHSVARVCREQVPDSHTMHYTFGTMLDVAGCSRNPRFTIGHAKAVMNRMNWDVLIVDEAETVQQNFEELIKSVHEMGKTVYIAGDPSQSAPMMGVPGFDMFGSVSHLVCGGRKVLCDLQFRNSNELYQDTLRLAGTGKICKYIDPAMSTYKDGSSAYHTLNFQMDEVANDMINGVPLERTFAFSNYKIGVCIVTDVLRKVLMRNPSFLKVPGKEILCDIIATNGVEVDPSFHEDKYFDKNVHAMVTRVRNEFYFSHKNFSWNGPSGRKMFHGTPLIMRTGLQYTSSDMFRTLYDNKTVHKATVYTFTGKYKYIDYAIPDPGAILFKQSSEQERKRRRIEEEEEEQFDPSKYTKVKFYVFDHGIILSADEIAMNFMYSFAIQREFVIGCTLKKLTMVQPYTLTLNRFPQYQSIKHRLSSYENLYGEHSVLTDDARMMQVMVTRATDPGNTHVLDLPIFDKTFWGPTMLAKELFVNIECTDQLYSATRKSIEFAGSIARHHLLSKQLPGTMCTRKLNASQKKRVKKFNYPKFPIKFLKPESIHTYMFCVDNNIHI